MFDPLSNSEKGSMGFLKLRFGETQGGPAELLAVKRASGM
jgi:hypothetical protein